MPVTNFMTANGQVLCETTTEKATVYYHPDALGNVTCASQGKTVQKATYTPYGQGTRPAMSKLGWVGTWGYYPTNLATPSHYVRARHFDNRRGVWTTRDVYWPLEKSLVLVDARVITTIDYLGHAGCYERPCDTKLIARNFAWRYYGAYISQSEIDVCFDKYCQVEYLTEDFEGCIFDKAKSNRQDGVTWNSSVEDRADAMDGFAYGNCCGNNRRCNSKSTAIDCIDRACRSHDDCASTDNRFLNEAGCRCHRSLCEAANKCLNSGCEEPGRSGRQRGLCRDAAKKVAMAYYRVGLYLLTANLGATIRNQTNVLPCGTGSITDLI